MRGGGPRLLLLFAVLSGLFLMHGMSAGATVGCHDGGARITASQAMDMTNPPVIHEEHMGSGRAMAGGDPRLAGDRDPASTPVAGAAAQAPVAQSSVALDEPRAMAPGPGHSASALAAQPSSVAAHSGETCVPLRPKDLPAFGLLLFALFFWRASVGSAARPRRLRLRLRWPHGPPPDRGVDLLIGLGVSRT